MSKQEIQAIENGQRLKVTEEDIQQFLGNDNSDYQQLVMELLLDVANGIYSPSDLVADIESHREDS